MDSSHAHRLPSLFRSASLAFSGLELDYINELQKRLANQFLNVIYDKNVKFGVPVFRNYIDGHNGLYRYKYETNKDGERKAYGPYELSGTFSLGWWSLLGSREISNLYKTLLESFPLDESQLYIYKGVSNRERHPFVIEAYRNGLVKSIVEMAMKIK